MRAQLYTGLPLTEEKPPAIPGIWADYAPKTNLIWLLFILKMLVKQIEHKDYTLHNNIPQVQARQPLQSCPDKANIQQQFNGSQTKTSELPINMIDVNLGEALTRLQRTLTDRLTIILEILDLEHGRDDMCCAADLVAYAIDQRWLNESDFFLA
jgi:serine/threonine-protein kinase haspin